MSDSERQSVIETRDTIKPMKELMRRVLAVPKEDVDRAIETQKNSKVSILGHRKGNGKG